MITNGRNNNFMPFPSTINKPQQTPGKIKRLRREYNKEVYGRGALRSREHERIAFTSPQQQNHTSRSEQKPGRNLEVSEVYSFTSIS